MVDTTNRSKRARERQRRTGEKYTDALRAKTTPDLSAEETAKQIEQLEAHLATHPLDVAARRRLIDSYGSVRWKRWFAGWGHQDLLDFAELDDPEGAIGGHSAILVEQDPDSDWAQDLKPGRNIFEEKDTRTFRVQSVPDPLVQATWDRLAARDPRHQAAADRYRIDAEGLVDEVLERWASEDPGTREFLASTRATWAGR